MEIILNNVSYKHNYYDNKNFFNNINLKIDSNTICGVIGKNGSGKSTLLELIGGINKPTSGSITFNYRDISLCRRKVGLLYQFPERQFFCAKVKDEIAFACKNYNISISKVKEVIKIVGLKEDILNKNLNDLTSGEKRLVAIASILVYNPTVILFDEPTIGLDSKNKKKIINIIKNLKNRYGKTILIASHEIDLLYELCDNIIVLFNGDIVLYGDPYSVFDEEDIINSSGISIPKVLLFERLAKNKNIKLLRTNNINDLIKEVYRNV